MIHTDLSFQSPVPFQLDCSTFDLDMYFPGKAFLKMERIEPYELNNQQREELRNKGWEMMPLDSPSGYFLTLSSQLHLIIGDRLGDQVNNQPVIWIRTSDKEFVLRYPVVLVLECSSRADLKEMAVHPEEMIVGKTALIFSDPAVFRYTLDQLGEEGLALWKRIQRGLRRHEATISTATDQGFFRSANEATTFLRQAEEAFYADYADALAAAPLLAERYWNYHLHHPNQPALPPTSLADIPDMFRTRGLRPGHLIPATAALESALLAISNGASGGTGWKDHAGRPTFAVKREASEAVVELHADPMAELSEDISRQLWQQVKSYSDLCGDALLSLLAHTVAVGKDERGGTWIRNTDILEYRGIKQKTHPTMTGETRDAGHRPEDLSDIARCIELIRNMHVTVHTWKEARKKGGRRRKVKQQSYLILISDFLTAEEEISQNGTKKDPISIAWYYRLGDVLGDIPVTTRSQTAWLLQSALRYNPEKQKWEKRLARYFLFQLRLPSGFSGGTMRCKIRTLLQECSLDNEINRNDPEKTKARFERAITKLLEDGHISDWSAEAYHEAMKRRPARFWLDQWLEYELEISAAPLLEELAEDMLDQLTHHLPVV